MQKPREMTVKNYYETLGIAKDSSPSVIKAAYNQLAMKWHPDKNPGPAEKKAEEKFKSIAEAYETLKDPRKRNAYDQSRTSSEAKGKPKALNDPEFLECFKKARAGDTKEQCKLGKFYQGGTRTRQNVREAFAWYYQAAQQGNHEGLFQLAQCYQYGIGTEINTAEALSLYNQLAEAEYPDAQCKNLELELEGLKSIMEAKPLEVDVALDKLIPRIEPLAEAGHAGAQCLLGECYQLRDVQKLGASAVELYKKAADQGNPAGQNQMGRSQRNRYLRDFDPESEVSWFQRSAAQGDALGQFNLGYIYFTEKRYFEAFEQLLSSAAQGNVSARDFLRLHYDFGTRRVQEEIDLAYYGPRAQEGEAEAQYYMGRFFEDGLAGKKRNVSKALAWYQVAANQKHPGSICKLAEFYQKGLGVVADEKEAFSLYLSVADHSEGQCGLAKCHAQGRGAAKNLEEAIRLYQLSIGQGNTLAMVGLGELYETELAKKDAKEAVRFYKLAADKNDALGQFKLAACYERGIGVNKNVSEAFRHYKDSAAQGNARGQEGLARCYEKGVGVDKNADAAYKWYKLAAENGNQKALAWMASKVTDGDGQAIAWEKEYQKSVQRRLQLELGKESLTALTMARDSVSKDEVKSFTGSQVSIKPSPPIQPRLGTTSSSSFNYSSSSSSTSSSSSISPSTTRTAAKSLTELLKSSSPPPLPASTVGKGTNNPLAPASEDNLRQTPGFTLIE